MLKSKNLTNYYPFEGNANDSVGGNNFTVSGATLESGKMGQQYNFDGVNDYLYTGTGIDLTAGTTVCMWIDFSNPDDEANYFIGSNTTSPDVGVRYTPGSPTGSLLFLAPGATSANYTTLNYNFPNSICHLAIVRTGNRNVDWYVNGIKIGSSDPGKDAAMPVKAIGRRSNTTPYYAKCKIDDLAFFNTALSQENIRRAMLGMHNL